MTFFFDHHAIRNMWKNILEPDGPHITIRRTTDVICRDDNLGKNTHTHTHTPIIVLHK